MRFERPDRVALVGPTSEVGGEVKELLAQAGYSGDTVELLDLDDAVGVLTDYGEEARVVAEAAAGQLREHGLACFCGPSKTCRELAPVLVKGGGVAIDCTGAWLFDDEARLVDPVTTSGVTAAEDPGILAVPSAGALMLASLQDLLGDALDGAVTTLLLPASEAGDAGPEELATQATSLLSFGDESGEIFGRQLAFDVWPEHASGGVRSSSAGVADQLRRLDRPVPSLSTLRAAVFHGIAASLYLPDADPDDVRTAVDLGGVTVGAEGEDGSIDSPARVAGLRGLQIGDVWEDTVAGTWVWAVMDNHQAVAAAAVATIAAHVEPPASDAVN